MQMKGHWNIWCSIAGFQAFHILLAIAARQLAVLNLPTQLCRSLPPIFAVDRTVTMLPKEWAGIFPDLAKWLGIPLLCHKSLYVGQYYNKSWENHLSSWLANYVFIWLKSEGSILTLHKGNKFLCLWNIVDDQLYFSYSDEILHDFESAVKANFDVAFPGKLTGTYTHLSHNIPTSLSHWTSCDMLLLSALASSQPFPSPITCLAGANDTAKHYHLTLPLQLCRHQERLG